MSDATAPWRTDNSITDWEFAEIGKLLCDHQPRDLALKVVRLQGRIEAGELSPVTSDRVTEPPAWYVAPLRALRWPGRFILEVILGRQLGMPWGRCIRVARIMAGEPATRSVPSPPRIGSRL